MGMVMSFSVLEAVKFNVFSLSLLAIWESVLLCMEKSIKNLILLEINPSDIVCVGICNQRETTILWDKLTGQPLFNAISWSDTRTTKLVNELIQDKARNKVDYLRPITGLPLSTCFSAPKIKWLMTNVKPVREAIDDGRCMFGTLDSWILWNLSGGVEGGVFITEPTNASRTMLMNLRTLQWDDDLLEFFEIPKQILPEIKSCVEIFGYVNAGLLSRVPIASMIGDQQAALFGQLCIEPGSVSCTYDEGCSLLFNTGLEIIDSQHGLTTTVAYKLGPSASTIYALEGSAPNAGSVITWLNDSLMIPTKISGTTQLVHSYSDSKVLSPTYVSTTINNNVRAQPADPNLVFVPAFTGFYAPFWRNARGLLSGLTLQTRPEQVVYATYEAIAFQTRQFLESLARDCPTWPRVKKLIVGGETISDEKCNLILQLVADLCGVTVEHPLTTSAPALGTMLAAGLSIKILDLNYYRAYCLPPGELFQTYLNETQRDKKFSKWMQAVKKSVFLEAASGSPTLKWEDVREDFTASIFEDASNKRPVSYSIPGTIYLFSSFALLLVADLLRK